MSPLFVKMEVPKKRGRGRPRISDEERKVSQARARARYRERVDVEQDRRRIRLHVKTFQQWRKLREKATVNSDDGFARLLMKCFSDHADEYQDESVLAPFQTPLSLELLDQRNDHLYREPVKLQVVQVYEEKPKRKRGRPPGRLNSRKVQRTVPIAPAVHYPTRITSIASPQIPRAMPESPPGRLPIPDEDLSHLSPSVRSARLAFSRALAQSFNAITSPDQSLSVRSDLQDIASSPDERIETPNDGVYFQPSQPESLIVPSCRLSNFSQMSVIGNAPMATMQDDGLLEPSDRFLPVVGEGDLETVVYPHTPEKGSYPHSSVLYGEVMLNDERVQTIQNQPESPPSDSADQGVETNDSSHLASEPDVNLTPSEGIREESIEVAQIGMNDSKGVKVPDPARRSRLDQITGGLLNRLKKRAITAESTQD
nr:uncharacterized protein LOC129275290 [Lytechinus pictus]